jgi:hypothetical protein
MRIAVGHNREDGGVGHPKSVDAVHAQLRVDDTVCLGTDPGRARRVIGVLHLAANLLLELDAGAGGLTGMDFPACDTTQRRRGRNFT